MTYKASQSRGYKTIILDPPYEAVELEIASDLSVQEVLDLGDMVSTEEFLCHLIQEWNITDDNDNVLPVSTDSMKQFGQKLLSVMITKIFDEVDKFTGSDMVFLLNNGEPTMENQSATESSSMEK